MESRTDFELQGFDVSYISLHGLEWAYIGLHGVLHVLRGFQKRKKFFFSLKVC